MRNTLIILLILLVVTLSCLPLFKNLSNINLHWDWLQMLSYYRQARVAIFQDHQLPLRSYYFGGGYPLIANPQDGSLNPFLIPVLIFGEVIGLKINAFLAHLIGALGMYYLTRYVLRMEYLGALFSTFVFCLGGNIHRILILGQEYISVFYAFCLPLLFAFFINSKHSKRHLIYGIFMLTFITSQAGLYCAPMLLFLFLFCCLQVKTVYLKNFFIICFFSFLLGAVKNLPMLELLRANPRLMDGYNPFWGNIYDSFLSHKANFVFPGEHWNYFYLGYAPAIFALAAFLFFWKKTLRLCILLGLFGLLAFGARSKIDLFAPLWRLPVLHSIEAPVRYFAPLVVFIAALSAGSFISEAVMYFSKRPGLKNIIVQVVFALVLIFTTWDLFVTNTAKEVSFPNPVPKNERQAQYFTVKNSRAGDKVSPLIARNMFLIRSWEWTLPSQYELMLENTGKINWYGNLHLGEFACPKYYIEWNGLMAFSPNNFTWRLNPEYRGEIYFSNNSQNQAELFTFTPNAIIAKATIVEPATLIINQNYDKYWRSNISKPTNYNGLLAVRLKQKGEQLVKFIYVPLSFYLGAVVSLITLVFIIGYLRKQERALNYENGNQG